MNKILPGIVALSLAVAGSTVRAQSARKTRLRLHHHLRFKPRQWSST